MSYHACTHSLNRVEREEHISRINELEIDLYSNRSDKLKLMHENAQYKRKNDELIESEALSRADCVLARKELLDKLQNLDNIYNDHETLKRTLYIQNEEMMNMSREVFTSKQSYVSINDQVIDMENMTLEYNKTIDVLQHEISRLRKELIMTTSTTTSMSSSLSSSSLPSTASSRVTSSAAANTAYGTMSRSNRVSSAITNSAYSDGLDGPYSHSRRPMTLHGLSRERNRVIMTSSATTGSRGAMSHASTSPLKAPGTYTASTNKRAGTTNSSSSSNRHDHMNHPHHHQQEYHYVDLQEQFLKGRVDRSSSSQQSQRNDVLKQYDDAMFEFNKTINSNKSNNNNSPNHKHSGVNDEVIMSFDGSTMYSPSSSIVGGDFIDDNNQSSSSNRRVSSSSFMCSPISTPQRPINTPIGAKPASMHNQNMNNNNNRTAAVAAAAAKILPTSINSRPNTVSVHTQYRGRGDEDSDGDRYGITDGSNMISKSLNDLKKCYSMPSIHHPNSSSKHKKGKSFINNSCIRIESSADPDINITSATTSNTTATSSTSTAQESSALNNGNYSPVPINIHDEADDHEKHGQQDGNYLHIHHHSDNVNDQSTTDDDTSVHVTIVESNDDELLQPPMSGSSRSQVKSKQRTLYVGSGLGMKHDAALNSQLENLNIGSAQYKLKKILGDRFD